jgi:hypothetical protein
MPKDGQRSITIKESIYDQIEKKAIQEKRSVSNMTEYIITWFLENRNE